MKKSILQALTTHTTARKRYEVEGILNVDRQGSGRERIGVKRKGNENKEEKHVSEEKGKRGMKAKEGMQK